MNNSNSFIVWKTLWIFLLFYVVVVMVPRAQAQRIIVDAAVFTNGHSYFFIGNKYLRFTGTTKDVGYPRDLPGGWQRLPSSFHNNIDAALFHPPKGKTYFFKGNQYVRLTGIKVDPEYPKYLPGGWEGLPSFFCQDIDAAIFANGHTYFFKGNKYVRFTGTKKDPGDAKDLPGGWRNLAPSFHSDINAALAFENGNRNYFFKGEQYIRLDNITMRSEYPKDLPGGWTGFNLCRLYTTGIQIIEGQRIIVGAAGRSCEGPVGEPVRATVRLRQHRRWLKYLPEPDKTLVSKDTLVTSNEIPLSYNCEGHYGPLDVFIEIIAEGRKVKSPTVRFYCSQ